MLKRNGEDCEHPVPNFPGLLTASELKAYTAAIALVDDNVCQFNERNDALTALEQEIPQVAEQATTQATRQMQSITVKGTPEESWRVHHVLLKSSRNESLLCSRDTDAGKEFGVIEKFDPNSAYARNHGSAELQLTGNNAFVLLQNYVAGERSVLQLFRQDIEAIAEENIAEMFPGQNHSRVVKAISARCGNPAAAEVETQQPARTVKIRM
jgi:hypothetical protein